MARYHDDYLEDLEKDVEAARSRYKRDREVYDYERDLGSYRSYPPPLDDPYYRHYDELESRVRSYPPLPPRESLRSSLVHDPKDDLGGFVYGSVTLFPPSPFDEKPKRNVKPPGCNTVFVGSMPENMTDKHVIELFSECGRVVDVRIPRGKRYAHVEFAREEAVDKAIEVSHCSVRVAPGGPGSTGKLYVDFAHHRGEGDVHKKIQEGEMMNFNQRSITSLSNNLHYDEAFGYAAKNVIQWFDKGHCDGSNANIFYGLLNNIHTHCRKMAKNAKTKEDEMKEAVAETRKYFENVQSNVGLAQQIYEVASKQKAWDSFTKAQRKTITQWKEQATEVETQVGSLLTASDDVMPPAKVPKLEGSEVDAEREKAQKEIEQLKTNHEMSLGKKEREVQLLKTLLDKFKQGFPDEWAKITGEGNSIKIDTKPGSSSAQPSANGSEGGGAGLGEEMEEEYEVLEGVGMDEDNKAGTLAAAAAAYAQIRTRVGSTEASSGLGISDTEVAIASVLAAFLTVHPLGATIDEITAYFRNFNTTYNSYYLESLLCRLPTVFQMSQATAATSEATPVNKWWFLGFQTCSTVGGANASEGQTGNKATTPGKDATKKDSSPSQ